MQENNKEVNIKMPLIFEGRTNLKTEDNKFIIEDCKIYSISDNKISLNIPKKHIGKIIENSLFRILIDTFDFGQALKLLKQGHKVCRIGWNGKNMFIYLQKGSILSGEARNNILQEEINKSEAKTIVINSHIDMKASDGSIVIGWLALQTDMLAEDWMEVE